ncbi:macrophage mannose receptor 1-like protein, partial [Leptotrombidium deliense]
WDRNEAVGSWVTVSCELEAPLVCERKAKQLTRKCLKGWQNFKNEKCIKYIPININYNGAVDICYRSLGTLVSITSSEEQEFVDEMARKYLKGYGFDLAWIGATRPNHSFERFVWPNGTFVEFNKWGNECPKNKEGANCVLLAVFKDKPSIWCNHKCDSNYNRVICEKALTEE